MKVIVKESGFYGGTWYDAKAVPVTMPDKVAKRFLPPFGDQLALPEEKAAAGEGKAEPAAKKKG
jgi:hypothetical protein